VPETITVTLPVVELEHRTYQEPDTGALVEDDRVCPRCGLAFDDGEAAVFLAGRPLHSGCWKAQTESLTLTNSWVAIAEVICRNPGKHSAATIRAALQNLSALARATSR